MVQDRHGYNSEDLSEIAYALSIGTNTNDLDDFEGHLPIASVFKWHFSYRFAVVDKTLTDACAVPHFCQYFQKANPTL